jgi:hypothetical protein
MLSNNKINEIFINNKKAKKMTDFYEMTLSSI